MICISTSFVSSLKFARDDDHKKGLTECLRLHQDLVHNMPPILADRMKLWKRRLHLHYSKHALQRIQEYTNQWSKRPWTDGEYYLEMTEDEADYLKDTGNLQKLLLSAKIVEIGLNENHDICKVSFVVILHMRRCLFFCVSPGGLIKTLNICPGEK